MAEDLRGRTLWPLSDQQQTMLAFIGGTRDAFYLVVESFVLRGDLCPRRLRRALEAVVRRHEVLRSVVVADSASYRILPYETSIMASIFTIRTDIHDVSDALRAGREHVGRPMDLDREPPLRVWLGLAGPAEAALVIAGHHLVFDGWSWRNFYGELERAYLDPSSLRPPKQYHETAVSGDAGDLTVDPELFRRRYRGVRALQARAATPVGPAGYARVERGPDLAAALLRACGRRATTPYMLAVSSFLVSLGSALGDPEAIVGTASTGRSTAGAVRALGYFSNTIFIGTDGGSPEEVLRHVVTQLPHWRDSPRVQWEKILEEYGARDLYPIRFGFERADRATPNARFADVVTTRDAEADAPSLTKRVAVINGAFSDAGVTLTACFRGDVLTEEWVRGLLEQCLEVLGQLCAAGPPGY